MTLTSLLLCNEMKTHKVECFICDPISHASHHMLMKPETNTDDVARILASLKDIYLVVTIRIEVSRHMGL